jgi:hypothetical protein
LLRQGALSALVEVGEFWKTLFGFVSSTMLAQVGRSFFFFLFLSRDASGSKVDLRQLVLRVQDTFIAAFG